MSCVAMNVPSTALRGAIRFSLSRDNIDQVLSDHRSASLQTLLPRRLCVPG